jgi:hypothetical protein
MLGTAALLAELESWVLNLTVANIKLSTYMDTGEDHDSRQKGSTPHAPAVCNAGLLVVLACPVSVCA